MGDLDGDGLPDLLATGTAADLDGDGLLDLVAQAEWGSNELRWWKNPGAA